MLHVLNGDATREKLERSGVDGEITVWADVLHDGPVPEVTPARLQRTRGEYLASSIRAPAAIIDREMQRQEALANFQGHDEVVFWFEHDLFDQLLLLRHLHWLSELDHSDTRFSLICGDEYLGMLPPARLLQLFPTRVPITRELIRTGTEGWNRFRGADPSRLVQWVAQGGAAPLEFMPDALYRLFEEYPSAKDGLSRTERQALEAVRDGARTLGQAFMASQVKEERIFMGDWSFWTVIRRLVQVAVPLLSAMLPATDMPTGDEAVALTAAGRRVLEGHGDHVALNGIDRWIGGVHLTASNCWRWHPELKLLTREVGL